MREMAVGPGAARWTDESPRAGFDLQIDTRLLLDADAALRNDHTGLIDPVTIRPGAEPQFACGSAPAVLEVS
jgi:hypothetical protein